MSTVTMRRENTHLLKTYAIKLETHASDKDPDGEPVKDLGWLVREIYQNPIDGMKRMGVADPFAMLSIVSNANDLGERERGRLTIAAPTHFTLPYVLYIGATTKAGVDNQSGEKGEGLKVAALLLMRDCGLDVTYQSTDGSRGWVAKAIWEPVELEPGKFEDALCFDIEEHEGPVGLPHSDIVIEGPVWQLKRFLAVDAAQFFAGSHNQQLNHVLFETDGVGLYSVPEGQKAHIFLAGLDRGEDERLTYTYRLDRKLPEDIDRDRRQLDQKAAIAAIHAVIGHPDCPSHVIDDLLSKKLDHTLTEYDSDPEARALRKLPDFKERWGQAVSHFARRFSYSEASYWRNWDADDLRRFGVRQVTDWALIEVLKGHGVKSLEDYRAQVHRSTSVSIPIGSKLERKIWFLQSVVRSAGLVPADISVFKPVTDKEMTTLGVYVDTNNVRLNEKIFDEPFAKALGIYVHELSHRKGDEFDDAFREALEENFTRVLGHGSDNPLEYLKTLAGATREWNGRRKKATSVEDDE